MGIIQWIAIGIFTLGYLAITLEHKSEIIDKSAIALITGVALWVLTVFTNTEHLAHDLEEAGVEIFEIFAFLLAAMTLVEVMVHYRFFDMIRMRLNRRQLTDKPQFVVIGILTFFLSAILDNLTITIVMVQISLRFFQGKNKLIAVAGVVIFANAGGAWSPIGDVTTIMLWLAEKFTPWEIISRGFLPSLTIALVAGYLLRRKMDTNTADKEEEDIRLSKGEILVISATLLSFALPLIANLIGLRPYMGLLLGLGFVWVLIHFLRTTSDQETHDTKIEELLRKVDIPSLMFFVGILLAVSALGSLGVLEKLSTLLLGTEQESTRVVGTNVFLGLLSAVVDNVPLTALAIDLINVTDPHLWVLLAIAVGTGGSVLLIGSVAGVIAMGMVKELNFGNYLKIASLPALLSYAAGIGVWILQYWLLS